MNDNSTKNNPDNYRINNYKTTTSKSFEYKTKNIRKTLIHNSTLNAKVIVSLKYLSNFGISRDWFLII